MLAQNKTKNDVKIACGYKKGNGLFCFLVENRFASPGTKLGKVAVQKPQPAVVFLDT